MTAVTITCNCVFSRGVPKMTEITRRNTLKLMSTALLLAGVGFSSLPGKAFAAGTITVLNWQGYGTDEAWSVKAFTEKTGIAKSFTTTIAPNRKC
jgi:spermidine/putrescine-binding protein